MSFEKKRTIDVLGDFREQMGNNGENKEKAGNFLEGNIECINTTVTSLYKLGTP